MNHLYWIQFPKKVATTGDASATLFVDKSGLFLVGYIAAEKVWNLYRRDERGVFVHVDEYPKPSKAKKKAEELFNEPATASESVPEQTSGASE